MHGGFCLLLSVQPLPRELNIGLCLEAVHSLAIPVVGQKVLLDVTRQLLLEISMNFLLCTPYVCVTGLLVSLKAQRKQWRLTGFAAWFTLLK